MAGFVTCREMVEAVENAATRITVCFLLSYTAFVSMDAARLSRTLMIMVFMAITKHVDMNTYFTLFFALSS